MVLQQTDHRRLQQIGKDQQYIYQELAHYLETGPIDGPVHDRLSGLIDQLETRVGESVYTHDLPLYQGMVRDLRTALDGAMEKEGSGERSVPSAPAASTESSTVTLADPSASQERATAVAQFEYTLEQYIDFRTAAVRGQLDNTHTEDDRLALRLQLDEFRDQFSSLSEQQGQGKDQIWHAKSIASKEIPILRRTLGLDN